MRDHSPRMEIQNFALWEKLSAKGRPVSFELEMTARCNNDCRHCYINLSPGDPVAREREMSADEILATGRQAVDMGVLWCLLTGGEPLLREDFADVYLGLKKMGLLVGVFTNACLITPAHVELFKVHPPRDIEVTVYGASRQVYERVTRRTGSWDRFLRGLDLLMSAGLPVRMKAMALRSNVEDLPDISRFCRERTKDYYRFDPFLIMRADGNESRNREIRAERLSAEELVAIEMVDKDRFGHLARECEEGHLIRPDFKQRRCDHLLHCGAGTGSFTVGWDGTFRLCSSLCHPDTVYDLRQGSLQQAWEEWVPRVRSMRGTKRRFLEECRRCSLVNLCMWCPAHAALETGDMDGWVDYFCEVAHARAAALHVEDNGLA